MSHGRWRSGRSEEARIAYIACVGDNDLEQCDAVFEYAGADGRSYAPLEGHPEAMQSLLWLALREGREGAWARLLDNRSLPAAEALSVISGLEPEQLAERWRDHLLDALPLSHSYVGTSGLLAGVWILVFAGFAIGSTRWRFA